jgi:hypothetical protein
MMVQIDVNFEQTGLEEAYRHRTYSYVNVMGVKYRVRWMVPLPDTAVLGDVVHGRRLLKVRVWGKYDPRSQRF